MTVSFAQKFEDLEDACNWIFIDLRDIDRSNLTEEDRDRLEEAYTLAEICLNALTNSWTWDEAHRELREVVG